MGDGGRGGGRRTGGHGGTQRVGRVGWGGAAAVRAVADMRVAQMCVLLTGSRTEGRASRKAPPPPNPLFPILTARLNLQP